MNGFPLFEHYYRINQKLIEAKEMRESYKRLHAKKKRNSCRNIAYRLLKTTTTVQCHIGKIADTSMLYGTYRRGFSHELKKWYSFKFRSCFICFLGRIIFSLERIY